MDVDQVLERFRRVQNAYADQGAIDTEPDGVAQFYLACALGLADPEPRLPATRDEWSLYEVDGADEAARVLAGELEEAERQLKVLMGQDPRGTIRRLRAKLWRIRF